MKLKSVFVCNKCAYKSPKWMGKCPACKSWDTLIEEIETPIQKKNLTNFGKQKQVLPEELSSIQIRDTGRIITQDEELNRVLGGGIVPGAVYLLSGDPGIGKSTLLLQLTRLIAGFNSLYITAEESKEQIKLRADRILSPCDNTQSYILADNNLQNIIEQSKQLKPDIIIIDSIQTIYSQNIESLPGSILQVRQCTFEIINFAKQAQIPIFMVGHITKEGGIAGPKLLEHMVDAVLQFEGDNTYTYRIIRAIKNRFGPSAALGIYEMTSTGLKGVPNPSYILISDANTRSSGTSISCIMQGIQPLLIETQALVTKTAYNIAQRSATGFNNKRLDMLLAVIEKKCGLKLSNKDVFLNITGGLKVEDTSADLGIAIALASSYADKMLPLKTCFIGEVGLTGEVRPVSRTIDRIREAEKLGFTNIIIPRAKNINIQSKNLNVKQLSNITEAMDILFN
ncbi:MAG: DNA repair protein RadA [Solitalea-like symbiont of Tyrophagus putrescentiae]